jgi:hypothetical protein
MPLRAAPRSMKTASPLDKGGLQGGFGVVTYNLVWVVDPETHPGTSRHPPPREGVSVLGGATMIFLPH